MHLLGCLSADSNHHRETGRHSICRPWQLASDFCEEGGDTDALNAISGTRFRCVSPTDAGVNSTDRMGSRAFLKLMEFRRLFGIDNVLAGDDHGGASRDGVVGG